MSEKGRQDMRIGTIRGCEIRVHPLLPLVVLAAAAFGMLKPLCLGFIAVLLHELSHVLAALACGFHINSICPEQPCLFRHSIRSVLSQKRKIESHYQKWIFQELR